MNERLFQERTLILDCQTTGSTLPAARVIELAWAVYENGNRVIPIQSRLCSLDGEAIPARITSLTGIDDSMLAGAPQAGERISELARVVEGLGPPTVLAVAHTASFEKRFLDHLALTTLGETLPLKYACTAALARRLLPHLPSHSLRAVAGHLGCFLGEMKRATAHVDATISIWKHLADLANERGIESTNDLFDLLSSPLPKAKKRFFVGDAILENLPTGPGVYRFISRDGRVLYVGKAANLKRRVRGYLRPKGYRVANTAEMLSQAFTVNHTSTEGRLEAALLEATEIQNLKPTYNTALRKNRDDYSTDSVPGAINDLLSGACEVDLETLGLHSITPPKPELLSHAKRYLECLLGTGRRASTPRILSLGLCLAAIKTEEEVEAKEEAETEESEEKEPQEPEWTPDRLKRRLKHCLVGFARHWLNRHWAHLVLDATLMIYENDSREPRTVILENCAPKGISKAPTDGVYSRGRVLTCELRRIVSSGRGITVLPIDTITLNRQRLAPVLEILG